MELFSHLSVRLGESIVFCSDVLEGLDLSVFELNIFNLFFKDTILLVDKFIKLGDFLHVVP